MAAVSDHGGSLARAAALFPNAPLPWIDLSTGINPHSYPLFDLPATALRRLPEGARLHELTELAALAYGAPSAEHVTAAPGTQILLSRVASLLKPGRASVLGPTYAEHARAAAIAGHAVAEVDNFAALYTADLAIVVNPNNPDGRIVSREKLLDLARVLKGKGGLLVVDEAFMDVGPAAERLDGDVGDGGMVVLRSFGKFYGLAGLRLGFAVAAVPITQKLEAELGPWAVAGSALEYGIKALGDTEWQDGMRSRLAGESVRLDKLLGRFGIPVVGGTSLFRFIVSKDAASLFAELGGRGILLRNFAWNSSALRIGLPATKSEWQRVESALATWAAMRGANHKETSS
jgi:cobalamin biosynthetic protein CobC